MESINFTKKQWLLVVLIGLFITSIVTAELISNKLINIPISFSVFGLQVGPFQTIVGALPWPIVFLLTDLINEFYGARTMRIISWITALLILFCFVVIQVAVAIPALEIPGSGLSTDAEFNVVFGQTKMVIFGSIIAFLVAQLLDVTLFHFIKSKTGNRFIWLRSTGSTIISQLIDSYLVLYIGFVLPGIISFENFLVLAPTNYLLKLLVAIALTPMIYFGHFLMRKTVFK